MSLLISVENALKLSREGAVIMPISPPHYIKANSINDVVQGYVNKIINVIGVGVPNGWTHQELD